MDRTLKVFCTGADQDRLSETLNVVERYQGFLVAKVPSEEIDELAKRVPVEDITDLFVIRIGEHTIDTSLPRFDHSGKVLSHPDYKGLKKLARGPHHHVVQFVGPIKEEWLARVKKLGGKLRAPQAGFSYIVLADEVTLAKIAALPCVRWIGHLSHDYRIAPSVMANIGRKKHEVASDLPRSRVFPGVYALDFFDAGDMPGALSAIEEQGFEILEQNRDAKTAVVRNARRGTATAKRIRDLSSVHGVRFIRERSLKRTTNNLATQIMGTATASNQPGLDLSGEGEVIAVCDTGIDTADPRTIHPDFAGRVSWIQSYPITSDLSGYVENPGADDGAADLDSGHGTHVAGSILGNGSASSTIPGIEKPIRGLAYKAKLVFQAVEQEMKWKDPGNYQLFGRYLLAGIPLDLATLFGDAYAKQARVHSNSWGGGDPGTYDSQSEQLDRFVWAHKDFCVIVAAGNDGSDRDGDGKINPMSVSSPGTAKNCITVGASENERPEFDTNTYGSWWDKDYPVAPFRNDPMANNGAQVAAFSSRGPTRDGRVKPDVVAPGTFILSTRSTMIAANNMAWGGFPPSRLYFHMGGTSMATPLTAGAVALIREYLRKYKGIKHPSAALLKAALIAGAARLPGYGAPGAAFDNDQGFGRVNIDAIVAPASPAQGTFTEVSPGLRTGEIFSHQVEVQSSDTPFRVVMAYSDFPGSALVNNLNLIVTAPDGKRFVGNQSSGGALTMDTVNNAEVINISSPSVGKWRIEVVGSNIPQGPQDFAVVYLAHEGSAPVNNLVRLESVPQTTIPDNDVAGVETVIEVTRSGIVDSIKIGIEISHTYIGDLRLELTAPNGSAVVLHDRSGASAHNISRIYDVHSTPDLAAFTGAQAKGNWRLRVSDHAKRDEGQLHRWFVEIGLGTGRTIRKESEAAAPIPDNEPAGIDDRITISEAGAAREIQVSLDITHTWIGDLRVWLVAPSGKRVVIHDRTGGNQGNLIKTYNIASLPALAGFNGENIKGVWTLTVSDHAGRDVGKLNRWAVTINY